MKNPSALQPWSASAALELPTSADSPNEIITYAQQLSKRDIPAILSAYEAGHYEMMASFAWSKTMSVLKKQISTLGATFVGELLEREDLVTDSDITRLVSDYDAITLAEDLGMLSATDGLRMRQARELLAHFTSVDPSMEELDELNSLDAIGILRSCVKSVLAHPKIDVAVKFATFRSDLESKDLKGEDEVVEAITSAPYFFLKTTVGMLLALFRTAKGAQLEHAMGNASLLTPILWPSLKAPEKWQIGRVYAELVSEGRKKSAIGLKNVLVKVGGFDFVPETLRSNSFRSAARDVLTAHEGANNFYSEPEPMRILRKLGSTIPKPAFPMCLTATLCVKLGNRYGSSWAAQGDADSLLGSLRNEQWRFYIDECLPVDRRVLEKLAYEHEPARRWGELITRYSLEDKTEVLPRNRLISTKATTLRNAAASALKKLSGT